MLLALRKSLMQNWLWKKYKAFGSWNRCNLFGIGAYRCNINSYLWYRKVNTQV